jgi:uncharacterized protein (UPF0335 family)
MTDERTTEGGADIKKLPKLRDRILTRLAKVDDAREDMKEIYAQAKDQHFHMRALKLTIRLSRMEPLERYDFLASLNDYCDALGLTGQADILGDVTEAPQPVDLADRRATARKHLEEDGSEPEQPAA